MTRKTCWERSAEYGPRRGMEGPYFYPNGRVLYYDLKERQYWDPRSDYYVEDDEVNALKQTLFNKVAA